MDDFPFGQEKTDGQEDYTDGPYGLDGRGNVTIRSRGEILQTWSIKKTWHLDDSSRTLQQVISPDGIYENTNPYYYREYDWEGSREEKGMYPHLLQDLTLYRSPDREADTFVMTAATHGANNKIYFTHTDNVNWVRVEDDAGESGWLYLDTFSGMPTENGREDIYDYIADLNTAD